MHADGRSGVRSQVQIGRTLLDGACEEIVEVGAASMDTLPIGSRNGDFEPRGAANPKLPGVPLGIPRESPKFGVGPAPAPADRSTASARTTIHLRKETHQMYEWIRQRLDGNSEQGFTLIELLVVIIIIGILLAIAVPSYLGFRDRVADSAAQADVRAALPAVKAYYADSATGSYAGMDLAALRAIDANVDVVPTVTGGGTGYCIAATESGKTWHIAGPGDTDPVAGACP